MFRASFIIEHQSSQTIENTLSQSTFRIGQNDSRSIILPRKTQNEFVKVTESIAPQARGQNRRNLSNFLERMCKVSYNEADLAKSKEGKRQNMQSHKISKSLLPGLSPKASKQVSFELMIYGRKCRNKQASLT